MEHLLHNPVFNALASGDALFAFGNSEVKFFDEEVSPFAGIEDNTKDGFTKLAGLLPPGRKMLYANPAKIPIPAGWKILADIAGLQFILEDYKKQGNQPAQPVALKKENVDEMVRLTMLTKPGPFNKRTIEFGNYFGFFEDGQLVAMTGQRLHVANFTEISAVCTHPGYLGRGFAGALLHHQVSLILNMGQIPFLHVRSDNERAIELYKRIGFKVSRPMNFYFLQKS